MDQSAVLKILQDNGAKPTPENINRLMQSSQMYGRALGLQGGMDESGPTPLMLDKLVKDTSTPSQMPTAPNSDGNGTAQNGAAVSDTPSRSPIVAAPSSAPRGRGMSVNTEPPSGSLGMDINKLIATPTDTAAPERGPSSTAVDNSAVDLPNVPMSMKDYALAAGIPLGSAAVGYALYQKMAGLDGATKMQPSDLGAIDKIANGPRAMEIGDLFAKGQDPASIRKMIDEVAAENAALKLGPKPAVSAGTAAVDKVAADTAKPAPNMQPSPTAKQVRQTQAELDADSRNPKNNPKPSKAAPRTATSEVAGPTRDATVVDDGVAAAERAKTNAALKPAQKPAPVPPVKDVEPIPSIKETYPQHTPIPTEIPTSHGPVEPMGEGRKALIDFIKTLQRVRK